MTDQGEQGDQGDQGDQGEDDGYAAMATVYDDWQESVGPFWELVLPRLSETLTTHVPAARSFLELGCGTGSLLLALDEDHPSWKFCGIDASAAMLERARRKTGAARIRWVNGGFDVAPPAAPYDAAGAFFDALNHACSDGELNRAFHAVARALVPGGLFVFDLNNRIGFEHWWRDRRVHTGTGWSMFIDASFDPGTGLARGRATIERPTRPPVITSVVERCFDDDQVRGWLSQAGFETIEASPWSPLPGDVPGKTWWVTRRL